MELPTLRFRPRSVYHSLTKCLIGAATHICPRTSHAQRTQSIYHPLESYTTGKGVCCSFSGKNICVSADGTANEFGDENTNVIKIHDFIIKDETQLTYYISGIGTYGKSKTKRQLDSATATTYERNVLRAYEWLCNHYNPGDRIFLFGFSRGAYQIRVIAGMIERVGLLYKGNNSQLHSVFRLYKNAMEQATGKRRELENALHQCQVFKAAFSQPDVKVHFVGAWDTVSSVGVALAPCLPETTSGMAHVCHFRHALALDERRVRYWPEFAKSITNPSTDKGGDVKEVWFAGCHSDVGGRNTLGPALRWMSHEAMSHGLRMDIKEKWDMPLPLQSYNDSLKGPWHILEYLPLRRPSYSFKCNTTRALHRGAPRQIQPGQRIHRSVFEAMGIDTDSISDAEAPIPVTCPKPYKPRASLRFDNWDNIHQLVKERLEEDPYRSPACAVQRLRDVYYAHHSIFKNAVEGLEVHIKGPSKVKSDKVLGRGSKSLANVSTESSDFLTSVLDREMGGKRCPEVITVLLKALAILPYNPHHRWDAPEWIDIASALGHDACHLYPKYEEVVQRHSNGGSLATTINAPSDKTIG